MARLWKYRSESLKPDRNQVLLSSFTRVLLLSPVRHMKKIVSRSLTALQNSTINNQVLQWNMLMNCVMLWPKSLLCASKSAGNMSAVPSMRYGGVM